MPPRLKKADKDIVRSRLDDLAAELRAGGAAYVVIEDWSHGRLGMSAYYGSSVDMQKPWETCDYHDWLCAEWDKYDSAWRLYGGGVPLHTEKTLHHALRRWRARILRFKRCRESWSRFKRSKSRLRWEDYLGSVVEALGLGTSARGHQ